WMGLASTNPAFSISASNSADKLNSLNFTFFFFLKMVRSHPIALSIYFSFHDVSSTKMRYRVASFPRKKSTSFFATYLV
ncbi:hypothetical protein, partial [Streptococcus sp. GMD4S]|uniref:hypothetical protein n=1 Tax=Streptococcus sp. GMD4S TaxID=1169673 RepID=UPI001ED9B8FF